MKSVKLNIYWIAWTLGTGCGLGQGTFENLDFEQANPIIIPGSPYNDSTVANVLPYWTVTIGGIQQSEIPVDGFSTGAAWVSLVGPGSHSGVSPIDGNYSVLLQNYEGTPEPNATAISQTGVIPSGTQSLIFEAHSYSFIPGPLNIMMGNQVVSYAEVGTGANYVIYSANISAWAGKNEQLTFADPNGSGNWEIDDISFSPNAVTPEPSPLALTGIGGLLFALYRRFVPKRR
jgi:hypothetical protein